MKKIAILVDSTAYIADEFKDRENLKIVYLSTIVNGVTRKELIEIDLKDYSKYLKEDSAYFPTTSQPVIGEVVETLEELKKSGYTDVIAISLSSGISGTFSSYSVAKMMVQDINVYPFDSEVSCQAEAFYVYKALELIEANKSPNDIIKELTDMKERIEAYFIVDDLMHLQRGGRLNGAQAIIGNLLQVKPILHFENKVIVPYMKVRTYKKTIAKIYGLFEEFYIKNKDKKIKVCVIHTLAEDKAIDIENYLNEKYCNIEVVKDEIGPVIATHLGLGAVAVSWVVW